MDGWIKLATEDMQLHGWTDYGQKNGGVDGQWKGGGIKLQMEDVTNDGWMIKGRETSDKTANGCQDG